jgi:hypothetical protein
VSAHSQYGHMEFASTVDFAHTARTLSRAARSLGLDAPSFRCPPRLVGIERSIRRRPRGAVVSIRVKNRPLAAVLADMIEGVVVANRLAPPHADGARTDLWSVMTGGAEIQFSKLAQSRVVCGAA